MSVKRYLLLIIFILVFFFIASKNTSSASAIEYTPLAPIDGYVETMNITPTSFSDYLNKMFKLGIALCTALAVLMIIVGGIQYVSSDAWSKKSDGKERIFAALFGLLIAFGSWALLNTIDPRLLSTELTLQKVTIEEIEIFTDLPNPPQPTGIGPGNTGSPTQNPGLQEEGETAAQAILRSAQYAASADHPLNTCNAAGTSGGKKACAYAVNEIVEGALGKPITNGLGTAEMNQTLASSPHFTTIGNDLSKALPGDIIMSPTQGSNTGHVGICETPGCGSIISNSSSRAKVEKNFNATSWNNYYSKNKGLPVVVYRPN